MSDQPYQMFEPLSEPIEAALRSSIQRFGVLVPVVKDQHGRIIDGHHRSRIADAVGVKYRVDVVRVDSDDDARAIAGAVGISKSQVDRDLSTVPRGTVPDRVTGLDGKRRPSTRPLLVTARNEREAKRTCSALATLDDRAPDSGLLDVKRVERLARQADLERRRAQPVEPTTVHGGVEVRHGDLRDVLADIPAGTVDAIVTDPPYGAEYIPLYADLGELAARVLAPDGVLAVLHGHNHLCAQRHEIEKHLRFMWPCAYLLTGPSATISFLRLDVAWKPLWLYARPGAKLPAIGNDLFRSRGADKSHHEWGQSESGMADVVSRLTRPGDMVVDPFLGGGTTAVVCQRLGRRFIGCDVDVAAVQTSRDRIGSTSDGDP